MTINLREGGVYLTRDGKKVGPMRKKINGDDPFPWTDKPLGSGYSQNDGWLSNGYWTTAGGTPLDLVTEVTESPVRKVTRTEIAPGTYGRVLVDGTVDLRGAYRAIRANVTLVDMDGQPSGDWRVFLDSSELRDAASIFTELADALAAMAEEEE